MKKNLVQDIVPPSRKSIRNIEIPPRRARVGVTEVDPVEPVAVNKKENIFTPPPKMEKPEKENFPRPAFDYSGISDKPTPEYKPDYKYEYDEPKKSSRKVLYISFAVFILAFAFGVSALFKSAKITFASKDQQIQLSSNFTANKNDESGLSFQIVTISKDIQKTVAVTSQANVQKKASGTVTIFNTTSNSQKLVATTRLQTPEGLIFRLNTAVTVPARQIVSGSAVPGSVSAVATADVSGDKYNVGLKDFTIPGFKGDPKYNQIYGRSKTPMSGGFSGMQAVISAQILASTTAEMQNSLKTSLATDIVSQIPANFIFYKNSMSFSFAPIIQVGGSNSGAVLDEKGTAYAIIFDRGSLSRSIASLYSITDTIKINSLDTLNFSYASSSVFDPSGSGSTLNFSLAGDADIVWVFDANKLKTDLLGLSKNQAKVVISGYPSITEVWIETSPFWNQTIPSDPKKVELLTK
jgi:hypothetical protein